jgi:hypothetical protein
MPPRTKSGELPKPMIRPGSLGCLPLNPLTLAYLYAEQCDLLLGYRDTVETDGFKRRPSVSVQIGAKRQTLSLDGKFLNGHSEALYRGVLPEVLLVAPDEAHLNDVLRDFLDYLQNIVSMGFFYPKKLLARRNPVEEHIPCTILTGNGLFFSQFITRLVRELDSLGQEFPVLDESTRQQIIERFVRGIPDAGSAKQERWLDVESLEVPVGRVVTLPQAPNVIRIAGGSAHTQNTIQTVLAAHGLIAIPETQSRNSVERLEFENILWRLSTVIMPVLAASAEEKKQLTPKVAAGVLSIGRHRQAFNESDNIEQLLNRFNPPAKKTKSTAKSTIERGVDQQVTGSDANLLRGLGQAAAALGLGEEQHLYESLAQRIQLTEEGAL